MGLSSSYKRAGRPVPRGLSINFAWHNSEVGSMLSQLTFRVRLIALN